MSQQIDLREVERRSFAVRFQDGLSDIYMGIGLMALALPELLPGNPLSETERYLVSVLICAVALVPWWAVTRFVSAPRLGTVRLGPAGKRRQSRATLILLGSVVCGAVAATLTVALPALTAGGGAVLPSAEQVAAVMAGWVLMVFSVSSYFLGFTRGYLIGLLFALAFGLSVLMGSSLPFLASGLLLVLLGLVVFVRFVRANPVPTREAVDVSV